MVLSRTGQNHHWCQVTRTRCCCCSIFRSRNLRGALQSVISQLAPALPHFALVPTSDLQFPTLIWESPVGLSSPGLWQQLDLWFSHPLPEIEAMNHRNAPRKQVPCHALSSWQEMLWLASPHCTNLPLSPSLFLLSLTRH